MSEQQEEAPPEELGGKPRVSRGRRIGLIAAFAVLAAALVLVAIPVVSGIIAANPTTYTSQPFGFAARFPAQPTVPVPPSKANGSLFVRWTGDNKSLSIRVDPLKGSVASADIDQTIIASLQRGSKALGGKVAKAVSPTLLDGKAAFDVTFGTGSDHIVEVAAIHHDRYYVLIMLNPTTAEAKQFRDSFVFID